MPATSQDLSNRIAKVAKLRQKWARKESVTAYRIYDKDIPELPYIVDRYGDQVVVYDRSNPNWIQTLTPDEVVLAVASGLDLDPATIHFKTRLRQKGKNQYEKISTNAARFSVEEGPLKFLVNLTDYLDTGLFLDHRPLRREITKLDGTGKSCLNLFCYTGSLSVAAAFAGFQVTSVDMSATYLSWAEDNFRHNGFDLKKHAFLRADATEDPQEWRPKLTPSKFDLICIDPPTFSNSKRMDGTFDVQRDHQGLLQSFAPYLAQNGLLVFSCNKRGFKLYAAISGLQLLHDVSAASIPADFRDTKIHDCYLFSTPNNTPNLMIFKKK